MSTSPTLTGSKVADGVLLLLVIAYVTSWLRSWYQLSHIPGPRGWGWSIFPWLKLHTRTDLLDQFCYLTDQYGPLVRVGPKTLVCSDPDVLRRLSAPRSPYVRADWYYAMRLNPGEDNIFSTLDETRHEELRRKMAAGYSGKENTSLEQDVDHCLLELIHLIDRKYISVGGTIKPMDLARKVAFLTSDIMSKVAFDAEFHDLRDDRDNFGYIEELEALFPNITWTATVPGFLKVMTNLGLLQKLAAAADGNMGVAKVKAIAFEQVGKRFGPDGKPNQDKPDMLGSFIRHGLTQEEAKQESVLNLTAGSDTTATAIRATLLCIMTNPRVYRTLMAEIDEALAQGKIPAGPTEVITEAQGKQLPYLQACIKEGLRWYPPVTGELSKKASIQYLPTPPQGDTICGYYVPGGVKVGSSVKAVHRNPKLFSPDPNSFRPERWILASEPHGHESSAEKLKEMERNNDLVFGYGKYQCLGKPVAFMELNKVFVELLRRFEFEVRDPLNLWDTRCCGTHLQKDMWVVVRKRALGIK
ncbi:uncharacterized protein Z518_02755 [Rhinocladiella mackenziei CBS 650.93]|uniref:Rhinocladiella mackenziei CBS 650.93 unplaced genomic scaffold supercont1.2, whole genome shotgun sequence n=1 Tax=Rhinocladiella mackenziei CBS 650.93 TaxID=1442369 RepID=A0A0D2JFN9_9EURO|nr:uncharacterized protein Z518_02755 [Rhinocladiella mackenziei CBS 650.93]KIX08100.1 hypothetical protein Z518_02755 [Rhinocladiella mackenziei CBS 650.93]